jgi:hypothetical protein
VPVLVTLRLLGARAGDRFTFFLGEPRSALHVRPV